MAGIPICVRDYGSDSYRWSRSGFTLPRLYAIGISLALTLSHDPPSNGYIFHPSTVNLKLPEALYGQNSFFLSSASGVVDPECLVECPKMNYGGLCLP